MPLSKTVIRSKKALRYVTSVSLFRKRLRMRLRKIKISFCFELYFEFILFSDSYIHLIKLYFISV